MRLFSMLLAVCLFTMQALAADNIIGTGGNNQLVDSHGIRWNAKIGYTTNGNGDIYTLGGLLASGDNTIGDTTSGNHLLLANDGKRWNLDVLYTTDGNGNVIPVSGGGGGGGSWGSITGTLSNQTDLQSALNAKQNSLGFTAENVANKDTDGTLAANSDTKYASQKATKTYVDTGLSSKFTLPSLTAGSVLFSNGSTIAQDNADFFWDNSAKVLSVGSNAVNNNNPSIQSVQAKTDPSNATTGYVADLTTHFTTDNVTTVIGSVNYNKVKADSGVTNNGAILGYSSVTGRQDAADLGTVALAGGYFAQLVQGNGAKHTGQYSGYLTGFHSIDAAGTIDALYDIQALPSSIPAGVVTDRYGIFLNPDTNYVKKNWLSGVTQIGGSSFSAPSEALVVNGATVATKSSTDAAVFAGEFNASSHTTTDGDITTIGLQGSATGTIDAAATNEKELAGVSFTVTRGDGTDDGTLSAMSGSTALMFHNSGNAGHTSVGVGYQVLNFLQNGTEDDFYDFRSQTIPAGSGTVTNHYGIYIDNFGPSPAKNWLSGVTQVGGSSFSAPTHALEVTGDIYASGLLDAGLVHSMENRFVDFLVGDDSTGDGSLTRPWKTIQHAYDSITDVSVNKPYTVHLAGGNNDSDAAPITGKPNVTLVSDYPIQIAQPLTISGGITNDGIGFSNIIFIGAVDWERNDNTSMGVTLNNTQFFSGPVLKQQGGGAMSVTANNAVFVNPDFLIPNFGSFFTNCTFLGTTTFEDVSSAVYVEFLGGYTSSAMSFAGGIEAYFSGMQVDVPFGATLTTSTTGNGTPLIQSDSSSIPKTITGPNSLNLISHSIHEEYTPALAGNWAAPPANVADALDKVVVLQQSAVGSQPACTSGNRGLQWLVQGGAGVADIYQVCQKTVLDTYVWTTH